MQRVSVAMQSASDKMYTDTYTVRIGIPAHPVLPIRGQKQALGVEL